MKIVIIEDEKPALLKLVKAIKNIDTSIDIIAKLSSVSESIKWFNSNPLPELIFLDIQLTDGRSFEILKNCNITCPVVFITAYDQYLFEAFSCNSIDYLLKPVRQEKLEQAIKKFVNLKEHFTYNYSPLITHTEKGTSKERILVRKGIEFISLRIHDIAYFYTEHKVVFIIDFSGTRYIADKSLSDLTEELDKKMFFRVNRKYLVNISSINKFKPFEKGKVLLNITPAPNEEIIISQDNASVFKNWIDR